MFKTLTDMVDIFSVDPIPCKNKKRQPDNYSQACIGANDLMMYMLHQID